MKKQSNQTDAEEGDSCPPTYSAKFTTDDFDAVWHYHADYFIDVLNGDMTLEDARDALRGLIGSKYDPRTDSLLND